MLHKPEQNREGGPSGGVQIWPLANLSGLILTLDGAFRKAFNARMNPCLDRAEQMAACRRASCHMKSIVQCQTGVISKTAHFSAGF